MSMLDVSEGLDTMGDSALKSTLQALFAKDSQALEPTFRKYLDRDGVRGELNIFALIQCSRQEALQQLSDHLLQGVVHAEIERIAERMAATIGNIDAFRTEGDFPHDFAVGEGQPWFYPGPSSEVHKSASASKSEVEQRIYIDPAAAAIPQYFPSYGMLGFSGPAEGNIDHDDPTGVPGLQPGLVLRDEYGDLISIEPLEDDDAAPQSDKIPVPARIKAA